MKSHEVFWGLPISSRFDRKNETVVTEIEVLESFGRIKKKTVQVFSAPDDGATCGITVPLAVPKLIKRLKNSQNLLYLLPIKLEPVIH